MVFFRQVAQRYFVWFFIVFAVTLTAESSLAQEPPPPAPQWQTFSNCPTCYNPGYPMAFVASLR